MKELYGRLSARALAALIFLTASLLYTRAFFFGYTFLDDDTLVLDKAASLAAGGWLHGAFSQPVFGYYRPVLLLSLAADFALGGAAPFQYHLTNVLLHAGFCALLFWFLRRSGAAKWLAAGLALAFAAHPALAQAVAWIPGRNDTLLALFALGSIMSCASFAAAGGAAALALHALLFCCALFTKESAALLPLLALGYTYLYASFPSRRRLAALCAVWLPALALWYACRAAAAGPMPPPAQAFPAVFMNLPAAMVSLGKFTWPFGLAVLPVGADLHYLAGAAGCCALAALAWAAAPGDRRRTAFGLAWFAVFLLPSFIQPGGAPVNFSEHRLYLPFAGLALALATPASQQRGRALAAGLLIAALPLALLLEARLHVFSGRVAFWENAVATSPSYGANWGDLGAVYQMEGRAAEGAPGVGRAADAGRALGRAVELNPADDVSLFNLGAIAFAAGDRAGAERRWKDTLKLRPDYTAARVNLMNLCAERGDLRCAEAHAAELARQGNPPPPDWLRSLRARKPTGK